MFAVYLGSERQRFKTGSSKAQPHTPEYYIYPLYIIFI